MNARRLSTQKEGEKMKYLLISMILLIASVATADMTWTENFDSYDSGSGLNGQGGWFCWDSNPAFDGYVSAAYARSAPHSVEIEPTSDMVQQFGILSGEATISGYNYIPTGSTGMQYFILLTVYMGADSDWALNMRFDAGTGQISTVEGTATTSIVYDQWVEVKVEIDLAGDSQSIYYNGTLLETLPWSPTSGIYQFDALDIFSDGGSSIYWDDFDLVATEQSLTPCTWAFIKASIK